MTGQSEYYEKFKIKKDLQRLVETPELYMIGCVQIMMTN